MSEGTDGATGAEPSTGAELSAAEAAVAAKEAGNAALKSADLPEAIERYEEAVKLFEAALADAPQPEVLRNNDLVMYGQGRFAIIDTAHPHFGDYVLQDLGTRNIVKIKVGKYEEVSKRFLRDELKLVPQQLFDLRLACLQNLTLVSLKLARASKRSSTFQETVQRADTALSMDGHSAKALMRKGAALIELQDVSGAAKVLTLAAQQTRGRDAEVMRLLELVLAAKGKGKGRGKGRTGKGRGQEAAAAAEAAAGREDARPESGSESEDAAPPAPQKQGEATAAAAAAPEDDGQAGQPGDPPDAPASSPGAAAAAAAAAPPLQAGARQSSLRLSQISVAMATLVVAVLGTAALLLRSRRSEGYEPEVEL